MIWKDLAKKVAALDPLLSERDLEAAEYAFLDWLGCAIAGTQIRGCLGGVLASLAISPGTQPVATLVGTGSATSLLDAVLANCIAGRAIDLDDRFEPGGVAVGSAVVPAALALAEWRGLSGRELLAAIVVGYSIAAELAMPPASGCAVCAAGKIEACGAAAASARLLGLDADATARALETAWFQAAAPPALNGVLAACTAAGSAASADIRASDIPVACASEAGTHAPGSPLVSTRRLSGAALRQRQVRLHAATPHTHAAIDAALALKSIYRIHPEDLESIEVHTYSQAVSDGADVAPATTRALRQSIPYCLAMVFLRGQMGPAELKPQFLLKAPVGWVMANTVVQENPEFTAAFPAARPARVVIRTRYGNVHEQTVLHPRGSAQNPVSPAELRAKFVSLAGPVLSADNEELLVRRVRTLSDLSDVRELLVGFCKEVPERSV